MALYSISGRPKPQSGGFELAAWYLMRVSGVALLVLVLLHFTMIHFVVDPKDETSSWIFQKWGSLFWRTADWLMLTMVIFHSFMGMRTVTKDYLKGGWRTLALFTLAIVGVTLFAMGTMVVFSNMPSGA